MPVAASDDLEFLAGMIHVVSVEHDANGAGGTGDAHADVAPDYQAVAGQGAVPCRVVMRRPHNADADQRLAPMTEWLVLCGLGYAWGVNHRLVFVDPDTGRTRYGYVQGRTVNAHNMNHHWTTMCLEYATDPSSP